MHNYCVNQFTSLEARLVWEHFGGKEKVKSKGRLYQTALETELRQTFQGKILLQIY